MNGCNQSTKGATRAVLDRIPVEGSQRTDPRRGLALLRGGSGEGGGKFSMEMLGEVEVSGGGRPILAPNEVEVRSRPHEIVNRSELRSVRERGRVPDVAGCSFKCGPVDSMRSSLVLPCAAITAECSAAALLADCRFGWTQPRASTIGTKRSTTHAWRQ